MIQRVNRQLCNYITSAAPDLFTSAPDLFTAAPDNLSAAPDDFTDDAPLTSPPRSQHRVPICGLNPASKPQMNSSAIAKRYGEDR